MSIAGGFFAVPQVQKLYCTLADTQLLPLYTAVLLLYANVAYLLRQSDDSSDWSTVYVHGHKRNGMINQ